MRLLERRSGPLSTALKQRIASTDAETLLIYGDRVLDAKSLDDIFGDWEQATSMSLKPYFHVNIRYTRSIHIERDSVTGSQPYILTSRAKQVLARMAETLDAEPISNLSIEPCS